VPQVLAQRALQLDPKEFHRMGAEKAFAFGESWNAMFMQAFAEQQRMALSLMTSFWFPWLAPKSRQSAARQLTSAAFGIAGAGLAPVHRRARANAKRLGRRRLR
jgi:hypothetical protein